MKLVNYVVTGMLECLKASLSRWACDVPQLGLFQIKINHFLSRVNASVRTFKSPPLAPRV
jgi:hypothetical protein